MVISWVGANSELEGNRSGGRGGWTLEVIICADSDIFGKSGDCFSSAARLSANVSISSVGANSGGPMWLFHR